MGYIISFDENLGFHRTQVNTHLRASLVRCRSIFEGYMLILNHHVRVTLIIHMNESNKNKTGRINIHPINKVCHKKEQPYWPIKE